MFERWLHIMSPKTLRDFGVLRPEPEREAAIQRVFDRYTGPDRGILLLRDGWEAPAVFGHVAWEVTDGEARLSFLQVTDGLRRAGHGRRLVDGVAKRLAQQSRPMPLCAHLNDEQAESAAEFFLAIGFVREHSGNGVARFVRRPA